ncbi:hypothetical protein [Terrabacter sp. 2RAF25]|uniref:hypothetical protein n=1 Tax=Terrabacter sp. 2RAF25 TaxID=3232998 RepID=UPI003F98A70E
MSEPTRELTARTGWWATLAEDNEASREQWALVVGLVLAGWMMPLLPRAALWLLAAVASVAVRCPRWVGALLVTVSVPLLLLAAVTGSIWYR